MNFHDRIRYFLATCHVRYYIRMYRSKIGLFLRRDRNRPPAEKAHARWWDACPHNPGASYWVHHCAERGTPEIEEAWLLYEKIIMTMHETCSRNGAVFCVFNEVDAGHLEWEKSWNRIREPEQGVHVVERDGASIRIDYFRHVKRMLEICGRLGIPMVANRRPYKRFRNDPHPNADGNVCMARDILDFLLENKDTFKRLFKAQGNPADSRNS